MNGLISLIHLLTQTDTVTFKLKGIGETKMQTDEFEDAVNQLNDLLKLVEDRIECGKLIDGNEILDILLQNMEKGRDEYEVY